MAKLGSIKVYLSTLKAFSTWHRKMKGTSDIDLWVNLSMLDAINPPAPSVIHICPALKSQLISESFKPSYPPVKSFTP